MTCIIHTHLVCCGCGDEAEEGPGAIQPHEDGFVGVFVEYEVVGSESVERDQCSSD